MEEYKRPSEEEILKESVNAKVRDMEAGAVVGLDPDEADELGFCEEDSMSLEDALDSRYDRDEPYVADGDSD